MKRNNLLLAALTVCCITGVAAKKSTTTLYPDWSKQTHSNDVEPNYGVVFPQTDGLQTKVQRIDITIDSLSWADMWADLDANLGTSGRMGGRGGEGDMPFESGGAPGGMMGGEGDMAMQGRGNRGIRDTMMMERSAPGGMMGGGEMTMRGRGNRDLSDTTMMERFAPGGMMEGGGAPGGMMMGGGAPGGMMGGGAPGGEMNGGAVPGTMNFTPVWMPCTITYDGKDWYEVGIRFKGNSSLMRAHMERSNKLSLKLDFDQFEKDYPELKNQRFYGFKQLNLNNNYNDPSFMREKVASDIFRDFGLVSAHTSFCEVYINGEYNGLYTIVEEVDDTVLNDQFSDGSGNIYKPDASFALGTFQPTLFNIKNKVDDPDYSDVRALYDILHSDLRGSDPNLWKKQLEDILDVDTFMKWLAANTALQNWDTYGSMAHNYYLYNNPESGLLTWIPWDNNEALQSGRSSVDIYSMDNVSDSWPLISYLIEVDEYRELYDNYLREFIDDVFEPSRLINVYDNYYNLLKNSAESEASGGRGAFSFDSAVSALKTHVDDRYIDIDVYLE